MGWKTTLLQQPPFPLRGITPIFHGLQNSNAKLMTYRNRFLAFLILAGFIMLASFAARLYVSQVEIINNQKTLDAWTHK
jgi:hypothetical protein